MELPGIIALGNSKAAIFLDTALTLVAYCGIRGECYGHSEFQTRRVRPRRASHPLRLGDCIHHRADAAGIVVLPNVLSGAGAFHRRGLRVGGLADNAGLLLAVGYLRRIRAAGGLAGRPLRRAFHNDRGRRPVHRRDDTHRADDRNLAPVPVFWHHPQRVNGHIPGAAYGGGYLLVPPPSGHWNGAAAIVPGLWPGSGPADNAGAGNLVQRRRRRGVEPVAALRRRPRCAGHTDGLLDSRRRGRRHPAAADPHFLQRAGGCGTAPAGR